MITLLISKLYACMEYILGFSMVDNIGRLHNVPNKDIYIPPIIDL